MRRNYIMVAALLAAAVLFVHIPRPLVEPAAADLATFPSVIGGWRLKNNTLFDHKTLEVLRPSDYLMRTYTNGEGVSIGLYVGYHNGGRQSGPIHSPKNCLPSSGWYMGESGKMRVPAGDAAVDVVRAAFSKGPQNMTCYYWYQVRGKTITGDLEMKLAGLTGKLFSRRKDASFIRIDVFLPPGEEADRLMWDFAARVYPLLLEYLPL